MPTLQNSLAGRLFLASVVLLPLLLGFSGYMLDLAFQKSLRSAEREALMAQAFILIGAAEPSEDSLTLPSALSEPRFSELDSGLYGWVINQHQEIIWQSESSQLWIDHSPSIPNLPIQAGTSQFFTTRANQEPMFGLVYDTIWEIQGQDQTMRFAVFHTQSTLEAELSIYRTQLWLWLGGLALLLLSVQILISRWGLLPLKQLASELADIEQGQRETLSHDYPREIQPVTTNLNQVLLGEKAQRDRYRNTLADLAHSLKTPLSVIRGIIEQKKSPSSNTLEQDNLGIIDEQVSRMADIVNHQLQRANAQVQTLLHQSIPLEPIIRGLERTLYKVYADKKVTFEYGVQNGISFTGEASDMMELLGNLLDNGFKYCNKQVSMQARHGETHLIIEIADDGPGVAGDLQTAILKRGARADTATAGQGIGLAVAIDIISSYKGSLEIKSSHLGGALFTIALPNS